MKLIKAVLGRLVYIGVGVVVMYGVAIRRETRLQEAFADQAIVHLAAGHYIGCVTSEENHPARNADAESVCTRLTREFVQELLRIANVDTN